MWADVKQQLASILEREVFSSLLRTPSYTVFLQKGGLKPPFDAYTKSYGAPVMPPSFKGTCEVYAALIVAKVSALNGFVEDKMLRAEVIGGPLKLYRVMQSRNAKPESNDLRRGTADIGDWWFGQDILSKCIERCRALENERKKNSLLTDTTPDRCLRVELRRRLAISIDWNAMGAIRQMTLDSNDSIPVITGLGHPMPFYSNKAKWKDFKDSSLAVAGHQLSGGDRQTWVPFTPQKPLQLWTPKGGFSPAAQL